MTNNKNDPCNNDQMAISVLFLSMFSIIIFIVFFVIVVVADVFVDFVFLFALTSKMLISVITQSTWMKHEFSVSSILTSSNLITIIKKLLRQCLYN